MTTTYKVLGQAAPAAATNTTLYTVPAATQTVTSTLAIAALAATTNFNVAVVPSGETLANKHYINYQNAISQNDSLFLTLGLTLNEGDAVVVNATLGNVAFSLFGSETA